MWFVVPLGRFLVDDPSETAQSFETEDSAREHASKLILQPGVYGVVLEYHNNPS